MSKGISETEKKAIETGFLRFWGEFEDKRGHQRAPAENCARHAWVKSREQLESDKAELIKSLDSLRTRLASAEEALGFYANIESWEATGWDAQDLIDDSDIEDMAGEDLPKGGKRARQHFAKYGDSK
jgi:hypothetical protein